MNRYPIESMADDGTIRIHPIGFVRSDVREQQTGGFVETRMAIELKQEYEPFLLGIDEYSHLTILTWLSEQTHALAVTRPQGHEEAPYVGMFACR